jgi:integrase
MLQESDVDLEKGTVFIHTMKRGEERIHLLPDVARYYLGQVALCPVSNDIMYGIFKSIQQLTGVQPQHGFVWHSIRRPLNTLLLKAGVSQAFVHYFLRWSMREMEEKYIAPVEFEVDKTIFQHHPFLPFWEAQ